MKDPVMIDLNNHLDKEARAELLAEARMDAADQRDAAKDAFLEDCFYEMVLDIHEGYLAEAIGEALADNVCELYTSLPKVNGLLDMSQATYTDKCAWKLIQTIKESEAVKDELDFLWEQK